MSLADVRRTCMSLPEVQERPSHGAPTWFIRGKQSFTMFVGHHHGDPDVALWCAAADGVQSELIAANDSCYFRPPYVGHRGWIGVRLKTGVELDEVAELLQDAYRQVAPATLVAQLDSHGDTRLDRR